MKIGKLILVTLLVSAYATITVVHINMAQPKPVAEATFDMIEIMTRAFDESEGGEGGGPFCYGYMWKICEHHPEGKVIRCTCTGGTFCRAAWQELCEPPA